MTTQMIHTNSCTMSPEDEAYLAFHDVAAGDCWRREPTWSKPCEQAGCGGTVERYRGEGDVICDGPGAHWHNASGQRLRDDWQDNPGWGDDDLDDMEGFERQMLAHEDY